MVYTDDDMVTAHVLPENVIAEQASFRVARADCRIERPEMLILKVGEVVDVDVILRMKDARKSMSACGCGGCGG